MTTGIAVRQRALIEALTAIQDNYSAHIRDFVKWLDGRELNGQSVVDYFRELNESRKYAAATVRIKRAAVKARLRQLRNMGGLGSEFSERLNQFLADLDREPATRAPKIDTHAVDRNRVLSREDLIRLLTGTRSERIRLFLRFLWTTGVRVSELCGIRLDDCEDRGEAVRIRILGKGRKERFVRIPSMLFQEITGTFSGSVWLFETGGGKPYRRTYVSGQVAALGHRILDRKISAHCLRHSFATGHIKARHSLTAVSHALGHSSTAITADLYIHDELSDEELFSLAV